MTARNRKVTVRNSTNVDMVVKITGDEAYVTKMQSAVASSSQMSSSMEVGGKVEASGVSVEANYKQSNSQAGSNSNANEINQVWSKTIEAEFTPLDAKDSVSQDCPNDGKTINYVWIFQKANNVKVAYRSEEATFFEVTLKDDGKFKVSSSMTNPHVESQTSGAGDDEKKEDAPAQNAFVPDAGTVKITNKSGRSIEVKSYNRKDSVQWASADKKTIPDGGWEVVRDKESDSTFWVHIKLDGTKVTSGWGKEVTAGKCYTYNSDNSLSLD